MWQRDKDFDEARRGAGLQVGRAWDLDVGKCSTRQAPELSPAEPLTGLGPSVLTPCQWSFCKKASGPGAWI